MSRRVDKPDTPADIELRECLSAAERRSFVMVAGASSGKTTSLIKALSAIINLHGPTLKGRRQRVACVTYTEIAAQEIWADVGNNPLVHVSTIHSFMWMLVRTFQSDIRKWVAARIQEKIGELEGKIATYGQRVQQRTKDKDQRDLARYQQSLARIDRVQSFTYGTGSDYPKGILGHDDVLRCSTQFLDQRPLFRSLLPPPSASLIGLVPGLALRMATSVKAMVSPAFPEPMPQAYPQEWGYRLSRFAYTPQSYPQRWVADYEQG